MSGIADLMASTAERLFRDSAGSGDGVDSPVWTGLGELGLLRASVPEPLGGSGLLRADSAEIVRLGAYFNVAAPIAETMVAGWLLASLDLPVPTGALTIAVQGDLTVREAAGGWLRIDGALIGVPWVDVAQELLVIGNRDGAPALLRLRLPLPVRTQRENLAGEPRAVLAFSDHRIREADAVPLGRRLDADDPVVTLAALRSVQLVGAMRRALEIAIEYASVRVQFGRRLGQFQVIQHNLAEAAGHYASSMAIAGAAMAALDDGDADRRLLTAGAAKSVCGEAATLIAAVTHQVMGAIGFTREHELHLSTRRLWAWREEAGDEAFWNARLGQLTGRLGSDALWTLLTSIGHESAGEGTAP